ncbi:MAG: hypothetical protein ACI4T1_02840 [Christensenellales bacterium]
MNKIAYLKSLGKKGIIDIVNQLGMETYEDSETKGTKVVIEQNSIIRVETYDNEIDDAVYVCINDFQVFDSPELSKKFRNIMAEKFGNRYLKDYIIYQINLKKVKIKDLQTIVNKEKREMLNLEAEMINYEKTL